jgi:hypothetical protein
MYYEITLTNWDNYSAEIAALEEEDQPAELSVWKILLFVFAYLFVTTETQRNNLTHQWMKTLLEYHPLPTADFMEGLEPALNGDLLGEFMPNSGQPIQDLNNIESVPFFLLPSSEGDLKKLGDRIAHWADSVVEKSAFQLSDSDRVMMYMSPNADDVSWAYGGVEGGDKGRDAIEADASKRR